MHIESDRPTRQTPHSRGRMPHSRRSPQMAVVTLAASGASPDDPLWRIVASTLTRLWIAGGPAWEPWMPAAAIWMAAGGGDVGRDAMVAAILADQAQNQKG